MLQPSRSVYVAVVVGTIAIVAGTLLPFKATNAIAVLVSCVILFLAYTRSEGSQRAILYRYWGLPVMLTLAGVIIYFAAIQPAAKWRREQVALRYALVRELDQDFDRDECNGRTIHSQLAIRTGICSEC